MVSQESREFAGGRLAVVALAVLACVNFLNIAALADFAGAAALAAWAVAADELEWAVLAGLVKQSARPGSDSVTQHGAVLLGVDSALECHLQFSPAYLPCKLSAFHGYGGVGPNCEQVDQTQLLLRHLSFEHFERLEHSKFVLLVACSFVPILPVQSYQAFLTETFDKIHARGLRQTSRGSLGITLLRETEESQKENYEQTDAYHHCAVIAAFSNAQFGEIQAVGILEVQTAIPLLFVEQHKDHFAEDRP